jgi:ABC-type dipeptide/oligopeptide/nickel transport system permease subunit
MTEDASVANEALSWPALDEGFEPNRTQETVRLLLRNKTVIIAGAMVLIFLLAGILGPFLVPYSYSEQEIVNAFARPFSPGHLFGTDNLGRDLLTRIVYGIRISLAVAAAVTAIALALGMVIGILAGYYGGRADFVLSSVMDIAWGFPSVLTAIVLVAIIGPGIPAIVIGMSVVTWSGFARIVRGEVLALREKEFIEAAKALGVRDLRIFVRHFVPNVLAPTIVMASFYMGIIMIAEAGLSFIGLGAQPPLPSLGQIISEGREFLFVSVWLTIIPGAVLALGILGFNLLGDGLRDVLDPRLRI